MGMYTELHFNSELKKISKRRVEIIKKELEKINCDSYYFSADTNISLRYDDIAQAHMLCIRTNIKNYKNELENFVEFITPYLEKYNDEFLGFIRYEETENPTLIYHPNKFIKTYFIKD